eukprot:12912594-Prorocentrum_lima.AAC.1
MRPALVHAYLEELGNELAKVGATRGSLEDAKSTVHLLAHLSMREDLPDAWVIERNPGTCKLLP